MISYIDGEYRGLAADLLTMDTTNVQNMERFVVADEGRTCYWDGENQTWVDYVVPASDGDTLASAAQETPNEPADGEGE